MLTHPSRSRTPLPTLTRGSLGGSPILYPTRCRKEAGDIDHLLVPVIALPGGGNRSSQGPPHGNRHAMNTVESETTPFQFSTNARPYCNTNFRIVSPVTAHGGRVPASNSPKAALVPYGPQCQNSSQVASQNIKSNSRYGWTPDTRNRRHLQSCERELSKVGFIINWPPSVTLRQVGEADPVRGLMICSCVSTPGQSIQCGPVMYGYPPPSRV